MTFCAAAGSSQCRISATVNPSARSARSRSASVLSGVAEQVEGEELQAPFGHGGGVLGAQSAGGGVPRVDEGLVDVGGVVGGEGGAQHECLTADLDAARYVEPLRD